MKKKEIVFLWSIPRRKRRGSQRGIRGFVFFRKIFESVENKGKMRGLFGFLLAREKGRKSRPHCWVQPVAPMHAFLCPFVSP